MIGKGIQLMTPMGSGDVFLARDKQDHVLKLENERMTGGWTLIQPSEGPTIPEHSHAGEGGGGGLGSTFED